MDKNGEARPNHSFCDVCRKLASQIVGDRLLCNGCAQHVKQAAGSPSLAEAALALKDRHR